MTPPTAPSPPPAAAASLNAVLVRLAHLEQEVVALRQQLTSRRGAAPLPEGALELLTCVAGGERFGLPLASVQEVVPMARLVPVPDAAPWVLGTLNLRGQSVVVIDVAQRLLGRTHVIASSELLVICRGSTHRFALLVDAVFEICQTRGEAVRHPAPGVLFASYLTGVLYDQEAGALPLLDVDRLLAASIGVEAGEEGPSEAPERPDAALAIST